MPSDRMRRVDEAVRQVLFEARIVRAEKGDKNDTL